MPGKGGGLSYAQFRELLTSRLNDRLAPPLGCVRHARLIAVLAMVIVPSTARGAVAAPDGTGSAACTVVAPCSLAGAAATVSGLNSDLTLLPGDYTLTETVTINARVTGAGPRARLHYVGPPETPAIALTGDPATGDTARFLRYVSIDGTTTSGVPLVVSTSGVSWIDIVNVDIVQRGTGPALVIQNTGFVQDSVLVSSGQYAPAALAGGAITGSTLINTGSGAALETGATTVRNSILRGGTAGVDVAIPLPGAMADIDYSALRANGILPPSGANLGAHNVGSAPQLVNSANGTDIHQLPTSPTIDAGTPSALNSTLFTNDPTDFEGDPRVYGAASDIGADEATPDLILDNPSVTDVTQTSAIVESFVQPFARQTSPRVEYGTTPALGQMAIANEYELSVLTTARPIRILLTGLSPATTYYARAVAAWGGLVGPARTSPTLTFTTQPRTFQPTSNPPVVERFRLARSSVAAGRPAVVAFVLHERADLRFVVDHLVPGHVKGSACRPRVNSGPRCTKAVRVMTLQRLLDASRSIRISIPTRVRGHLVPPGVYRVSMTGRTAAGQPVTGRRTTFVVRRPLIPGSRL